MTRDLFGEVTPPRAQGGTVSLPLVLHLETAKGLLLGPDIDRRKAQWVPRAHAVRGEGPERDVWTLPRWIAAERGWL